MGCDLDNAILHSYFDGELSVGAAEFQYHLARFSASSPTRFTNLRASRKSGREGLRDVVCFDDVPTAHLCFEGGELLTLERAPLHGKERMFSPQDRTT